MPKGVFTPADQAEKRKADLKEFEILLAQSEERRRAEGDEGRRKVGGNKSVMSSRAGKSGNEISILGHIFNSQKIGRHGAKKLSESRDSIKKMGKAAPTELRDRSGAALGVYFDPFGEVIRDGEQEEQRPEELERLNLDFLKRVEGQRKLAAGKNDFEKGRYSDVQKDYVVAVLLSAENGESEEVSGANTDRIRDHYVNAFDHTRTFTKDYEGVDAIPDNFALVVSVDPPTDVYVDYNKDRTARTTGAFGKKNGDVNYLSLLDDNMKKSADYREIVERGRRDAAQAGMEYDPEMDPNIAILRTQVADGLKKEQGHSFVRMVAKRGNDDVHSYSFGFIPAAMTSGIGAVTLGMVENPDSHAKRASVIERSHPVSYANYLRAATKIRGVMGSKRTYSFLGYNCTSFAADVANEAGISISKKDSGDQMKTFRRRKVWVDSPCSLARYVREAHPEARDVNGTVLRTFERLSFTEQFDGSALTNIENQLEERKRARTSGGVAEHAVREGGVGYTGERYTDQTEMNIKEVGTAINNKALFTSLERFKKNPAFLRLFEEKTYLGETETEFAERLFSELLTAVTKKVKKIDKEMQTQLDIPDTEYFTSDRIAEERSKAIRERREKMRNLFGTDTGAEFISRVCTQGDFFDRAAAMMGWTVNLSDTEQVNLLEEEPDAEEEQNDQSQIDMAGATRMFRILSMGARVSEELKNQILACGDGMLNYSGLENDELGEKEKLAFVACMITHDNEVFDNMLRVGTGDMVENMGNCIETLNSHQNALLEFYLQLESELREVVPNLR